MSEGMDLPTLPQVAVSVLQGTSNDGASVREVAGYLMVDPPLAARVLRVVNSNVYELRDKVGSISQAMMVLGLERIRDIVLSLTVIPAFDLDHGRIGLDREMFWRHSTATAFLARTLSCALGLRREGEAFAAGLLHDLGYLFLDHYFHRELARAYEKAMVDRVSLLTAEQVLFGTDHAAAGGLLASTWQFPGGMVDVLIHHHRPDRARVEKRLCAIVSLADLLAELSGKAGIGEISGSARLEDQPAWQMLRKPLSEIAHIGPDQFERIVADSIRSATEFFSVMGSDGLPGKLSASGPRLARSAADSTDIHV